MKLVIDGGVRVSMTGNRELHGRYGIWVGWMTKKLGGDVFVM